ncbi:MAG: lysophospholipase [Dehalococcoidales bacterium]|nr:lysophospholipase [Dehalococcoidales bacterium]
MQHTEGKFPGCKNLNLYYQSWVPDGIPIAVLVVVHGLAEHSGRYANLVNYLVPRGYAVCSFDLRGHGKSEGTRGYVERFSCYIDDLKTFCDMVCNEHKSTRVFMVGHSMGSAIAIAYAIKYQNELDGLILSGATLKAGASISNLDKLMAKVLSVFLPKMGVAVLDASAISRDKAVVDAYVNDPLVYRGKVSARLGAELLRIIEKLPKQIPQISLPILIMHGAIDRLSDPASSKMLYELVQSKDKTLNVYEDFYHEIFNDPERQKVFSDMETWLKRHV